MLHESNCRSMSAFSWWLRTGRLPPAIQGGATEHKYNPWHDPIDGRFTFAGSGNYFGIGGFTTDRSPRRNQPARRAPIVTDNNKPREQRTAASTASQLGQPVGSPRKPVERARPSTRPNPVREFGSGVAEGLYNVAEGTARGAYDALTTNPVTTARNTLGGLASMIDTALEAENTPARIQVARAANALSSASARDLGRGAGSTLGNVALTVAPGAGMAKVSAVRQLRKARPRPTFSPPEIGWVKETLNSDKAWKSYNDGAPGARPGLAPTLMRTMPNGKRRPVKFDGYLADYVIDRKYSVSRRPHAVAQMLRQSKVLSEHDLIGVWEVTSAAEKAVALKMFRKHGVKNIKVRIVAP